MLTIALLFVLYLILAYWPEKLFAVVIAQCISVSLLSGFNFSSYQFSGIGKSGYFHRPLK